MFWDNLPSREVPPQRQKDPALSVTATNPEQAPGLCALLPRGSLRPRGVQRQLLLELGVSTKVLRWGRSISSSPSGAAPVELKRVRGWRNFALGKSPVTWSRGGLGWVLAGSSSTLQPLLCSSGLAVMFNSFSVVFGVTLAAVAFVTVTAPSNPARSRVYPERKPQAHKSSLHKAPRRLHLWGEGCAGCQCSPLLFSATSGGSTRHSPCTVGLLAGILQQREEGSP